MGSSSPLQSEPPSWPLHLPLAWTVPPKCSVSPHWRGLVVTLQIVVAMGTQWHAQSSLQPGFPIVVLGKWAHLCH